jgi:hypothetical protein
VRESRVPRIRFLLDENVSNSVVDVLESRGHVVLLARDVMAAGTPDAVLAVLVAHESMVIVTHDRDFRAIRRMLPERDRRRYAQGAGRLQLEIPETDASAAIEDRLPLLEFWYEDCQRKGKPFQVILQKSGIKLQE